MSHQTEYKSAYMTDIKALALAVKELGGVLEEASDYAGYGGKRVTGCTHRIVIPGCIYDVGIVCDGNEITSMKTDWYRGYVANALGEGFCKLKQMYGVVRTEKEARLRGYTVRREYKQDKILLTIGGIR